MAKYCPPCPPPPMFLRPCDVKIQSMIDKDYAERVSVDELFLDDGSVCYIHHHPVLSKPGKVRPVFDCAASFKGVCLNSEMKQGPDNAYIYTYISIDNDLVSVLLRFQICCPTLQISKICIFKLESRNHIAMRYAFCGMIRSMTVIILSFIARKRTFLAERGVLALLHLL